MSRANPCRVSFGAVALLAAGLGCSSSSSPSPDAPVDAAIGSEAGTEAGPLGEAGGEVLGTGSLTGIVADVLGVPILGAKLEANGLSVYSDAQGKFTLAGLPVGTVKVTLTQSWFQPLPQQDVVVTGPATPWNPVMTEWPLMVTDEDRARANAYNATFDWTKQTLSIAIAPAPTRCAFDNAVYLHNPALYRDSSAQAPVTPAVPPQIVGGIASGFTFPVLSGANKGQEALDLSTIADSVAGTPLGPVEPASYMVWRSMVNWLNEWSATKAVTVKVAGLAVQQQGWGSNALRPQDIEKVFIDATGRIWVKVVFEDFVQLGPGITDDDGDGRKEIYAALGSSHYTAEIVTALVGTYMTKTFNTHELSTELSKSLNELYSTTAAKVENYIGQRFTAPGLGTITYPFVVLKHSAGQENVILVAPLP